MRCIGRRIRGISITIGEGEGGRGGGERHLEREKDDCYSIRRGILGMRVSHESKMFWSARNTGYSRRSPDIFVVEPDCSLVLIFFQML